MSDETKAISYSELTGAERTYINGEASKLAVEAHLIPPADIERMLEKFYSGESDLQRLHRAHQYVAEQKRIEREAQEPEDPLEHLPSESERFEVAKKLNVLPQFVKTREEAQEELQQAQEAAAAQAARQIVSDAIEAGDHVTLAGVIRDSKEPELKAAAQAGLRQVWPGAPDWLVEPEPEE